MCVKYLIYIMTCIFVTSNVRLTDELVFSLMHSSSIPKLLKLIPTVFIKFFSFMFCTRPMFAHPFTSTTLVVSPFDTTHCK